MKTKIERCMGCMCEKLYAGPCKICGYIDNNSYPAGCLAPGTLLEDRYVTGKIISKNGEGVVYLAFDTAENTAVEIQEFLPDALCARGEDGEAVAVKDGSLPLFKSYLSEFADLHKTIISDMAASCLKREFNIFSANNTGYVVSEHLNGMTLEDYIAQNGGKMQWSDISDWVRKILATLDDLHEKGIVHRGISPSTLFVTKEGRLVMTSIAISAARTSDSQINCEMFPGYSASEQYDLSERQGSWTDIYALSAVMYNALTGITPPDAGSRKDNDTLVPPAEAESTIPANVAEAITDGMRVNGSERTHNIGTLVQQLFDKTYDDSDTKIADPDNDGPISPIVSVKLEPEYPQREKKRSSVPTKADIKKKKLHQKKMSNIGTVIGIVIFFSLVAALIIAIFYFADEAQQAAAAARTAVTTTTPEETEPPETTAPRTTTSATTTTQKPAGDILLLPDFTNRFFNPTFESRYSMLTFEAEYEYSDEYSEGIIYEQDIPEGTQVRSGTVVHIKVSKGAAYTYLPDYVGMKLSEYTNKLVQLGVRYEAESEETSEVKAGYVVRCSKEIGDKVYISQNEVITVYYAVTPTVTTTEETEPEPEPTEPEQEITGNEEEDTVEEIIAGE